MGSVSASGKNFVSDNENRPPAWVGFTKETAVEDPPPAVPWEWQVTAYDKPQKTFRSTLGGPLAEEKGRRAGVSGLVFV